MAIIDRKKKSRKEFLENGRSGLVYVLGKYENVFSESLLEEITELYEEGYEVEDIAETFNRPVMEIIMALLHQADEEKIKRPFAYRRGKDGNHSK
jgi:predicted RND superfamily exporter protein